MAPLSPCHLTQGTRLRPTKAYAPDLWKITWNNKAAVLKTYASSPPLYRQTVGRLAIKREWWALHRLKDTGCAPLPFTRPNPWSLVMEAIDGCPLEQLHADSISIVRVLNQAEHLLACLKKAGIAHGDIGHDHWGTQGRESNLFWTTEQRLIAIDFAGCWNLHSSWPTRPLAQALSRHDQLLTTKILYHLGNDALPQHPAWTYPSQQSLSWWELMGLLGKL